ncbi:MAG TPA: bifunctional DNA-formamidopyrimidine glycosylase/DNA-(apurinic or apyrimidinic site) lyase [Chthonomonadaceae bacterium]|nr:bifunctional DNA-formamidopyrimidine glycosylase/DNA-(apurinic or apyrimidinic site) lyase [Chthonomonadaceae bacterium]
MPELPEVESVRRLLERRLSGASINAIELVTPKILRTPEPAPFAVAVTGTTLTGVGRRGKYLLLRLEKPAVSSPDAVAVPVPPQAFDLVIHLKMRGWLRVERLDETPGPYLCVALTLNADRALRYYDMWRWGAWALFPAGAAAAHLPGLAALGPEPFDPAFTSDYLWQQLVRRRTPLKPLLLGQRIVAGLGNLYCDECLHRARLHPARPAQSLRPEEARRLHEAIVAILNAAVAQGGAYVETLAARHANLDDFNAIYIPRVYDRPEQPCPACGQALIKTHLHGRGTTLCPNCQPDADIPASLRAEDDAPR